jgi:aerobic carbon-monoxide dehydrogenase medium subunit
MRLRPFQLHRPATVAEALDLKLSLGEAAALYAGGTELLLVMKLGLTRYDHLIDMKTVAGVSEVTAADGVVEIGAAMTHTRLEHSPVIREHLPHYASMTHQVANIRIRNAGTLGGNLCFGDPHSDPATYLCALDATAVCASRDGRRVVPIGEFMRGPYTTALREDELLASVRVPAPAPGTTVSHQKIAFHERPAVTVTCALTTTGEHVTQARIAVGSVGGVPARVQAAEDALVGIETDPVADLGGVADLAAAGCDPAQDANGSIEYKRQLVRVLVGRGLRAALAGG